MGLPRKVPATLSGKPTPQGLPRTSDPLLCSHARRERLAATEAKLKAAVQDKGNVQLEKAALERELKGLRGQAGRLTKARPGRPRLRQCSAPLRARTSRQ